MSKITSNRFLYLKIFQKIYLAYQGLHNVSPPHYLFILIHPLAFNVYIYISISHFDSPLSIFHIILWINTCFDILFLLIILVHPFDLFQH